MELYIIRHGETAWNVEKKLQGRSDVPLNAYGIELAEITSEALKDIEFDAIYSSPLCRAYETARILRRERNIEIITDERLMEMSFGDYEGVPADQVPGDFSKFFSDPEHYETAPNGESYEEVLQRAGNFIDDVILPNSHSMNRMLVVAHGALNKAIMVNLNNQTIADFWKGVFQRNCCVNIYEIDDQGIRCTQNGKIYYETDQESFYDTK